MALAFTSILYHLALVVLVLIFSPLCFGKCHKNDEAGLLGFKSSIIEDPEGMLRSWIPGTECCKWSGVLCDNPNSNRVTYIYLSGQGFGPNGYLTGTISPSLLKLQHLTDLFLISLGNLTGPLPKGLFNLPMLEQVFIENNKLSGPVSFGKNPKSNRIVALSLLRNQFTGPIPSSISQFTHLEMLKLNDNKLSGGIPYGIQGLKNLTNLNLQNNRLSGEIPNIFKSLDIRELDISYNKFSGKIPPSFSFLAPQLALFNASHNALTGKIPKNLKNLRMLDLSYNHLSGRIPTTKFPIESFVGNDHLCGSPLPSCKK